MEYPTEAPSLIKTIEYLGRATGPMHWHSLLRLKEDVRERFILLIARHFFRILETYDCDVEELIVSEDWSAEQIEWYKQKILDHTDVYEKKQLKLRNRYLGKNQIPLSPNELLLLELMIGQHIKIMVYKSLLKTRRILGLPGMKEVAECETESEVGPFFSLQ